MDDGKRMKRKVGSLEVSNLNPFEELI